MLRIHFVGWSFVAGMEFGWGCSGVCYFVAVFGN